MAAKYEVQLSLRAVARDLANHARARAAEREKLRTSPMLPRENAPLALWQHDEQTRAQRAAYAEKGRALLAQHRDAVVLKSAPDFRPAGSAQASWVAAIATQAPHYSPRVLAETLRTAALRGDTPMIAALMPLAESFKETKKDFAASTELSNAVVDATNALRTPEIIASEENAAWLDAADAELSYLQTMLDGDGGVSALDTHTDLQAFNVLGLTGEGA